MKCNRYAIYGWRSKGSMKYKPVVLGSFPDILNTENYLKQIGLLYSHAETCNGEIESEIALVDEPYMGGSNTILEIDFICNKCKYNFNREGVLPYTLEKLNEFLTKIIRNLD